MQTLTKLIILLLLTLQLSAQITFPDPDKIATKEWVLEQIAKSRDSISPVPPVIVVDSCKAGPQLLRVYAVTPTSLTAQFHGVDVFQIKWTVTKRLLSVASGEISPKSSVLAIPLPALASGEYTLKLEGINCTGSSNLGFTVPDQSGGGGVTPVPGGDLPPPNYGVDYSTTGDWHIRFNTGRRVDWKITLDGKLSDVFADTYTGEQRQLTINGERYNVFYTLQGKAVQDIKDIALPVDSYYIQKVYARASKFPDINTFRDRYYELTPEDQTIAEAANTELLIAHKGKSTGTIPTYYPNFLQIGTGLSVNKIAGFKNMYSVPDSDLTSKGITHLMDTGGNNDIAPRQKFTLAKLHTGGAIPVEDESIFERAGYNYALQTNTTKNLVLTSEIGEELNGKGIYNTTPLTTAFFRGYLKRFQETYPGIQLTDIYTFGGYNGIGNQGEPGRTYKSPNKLTAYRKALSSLAEARRNYNPSVEGFSQDTDSYYTSGRFDVHNITLRLYYQSLSDLNGGYFPNLLFAVERLNLAAPDRLVFIFTWEKIQDLIRMPKHFLDVTDGWTYRWTSPNGRLYIGENAGTSAPPYICYGIGFFAQLRTSGFGVWSDASGFKNVPVETHSKSLTYAGNWKNWKPEGGQWEQWKDGTPGQANLSSEGGFSKFPLTSIDAFYEGAADYAKIESRVNIGKFWVKHSTDGGKTWYTPNPGSRGLEISDTGKPNYNDKNPVVDISAQRLPIAIFGEGTDGSVLIYYNTYKLPTESDNVQIEHKGKTYNIGELRGSKIYTIPL